MSPPPQVPHDPVPHEHGSDEFGQSAVSTIGEYAAMLEVQRLDDRAAVLNRVAAVAGTAGAHGDDA
jgi:hypothetical protein